MRNDCHCKNQGNEQNANVKIKDLFTRNVFQPMWVIWFSIVAIAEWLMNAFYLCYSDDNS